MEHLRLSSIGTFPLKFIWPPFFAVLTVLFWLDVVPDAMRRSDGDGLVGLFAAGVLTICAVDAIWNGCRFKSVVLIDGFLRVSNYLRDESIPIAQIRGVTEQRWLPTHAITVHFRESTPFGDRIVFRPRGVIAFWTSHPTVHELRNLTDLSDT
jgi:hypothetical protein